MNEAKKMAFIATNKTAHGGMADRFADFVRAQRERLQNYRVYRQTFNELARLDDRDLADMGINRAMIPSIAREAAFGTK